MSRRVSHASSSLALLVAIVLGFFCLPSVKPADTSPARQDAVAALQRGDFASAELKLRAELKRDPNDAETLSLLGTALRGGQVSARQFADLREDHHALLASLDTDHPTLLADETDRITNSLNTLREQIMAWRGRAPARPTPEPMPQQA